MKYKIHKPKLFLWLACLACHFSWCYIRFRQFIDTNLF